MIRCACFACDRLNERVFSERDFSTKTKILIYKAVILTTFLIYGCETWVAYRRHVKVLEQFQQRILIAILGVHWQDPITNARILEQADTTSIKAHIVSWISLCFNFKVYQYEPLLNYEVVTIFMQPPYRN